MSELREGFDRSRPDLPAGTSFGADRSLWSLLEACPRLSGLRGFVRADLRASGFADQRRIEEAARSSYDDHGYGDLFYGLVRVLRPTVCVELGVLQGLSLLCAAAALRDNRQGRIEGFDLFESYPYHHETLAGATGRIRALGLEAWAGVCQADAREVHRRFEAVDYLHVDLSNDGDVYAWVFEQWAAKVRQVIVLEGGAAERDRVGWMVRYGKAPIVPALAAIRRRHRDWSIFVLEPYPSVTIAVRAAVCRTGR
jgi:hypothetical protein